MRACSRAKAQQYRPRLCRRMGIAVVVAIAAGACASAPPASKPAPTPPPPVVVAVPLDKKIGWILRLEDERRLSDLPHVVMPGVASIRPATDPDLLELVVDTDPAVRRRAALAIGRVGLPGGVAALAVALTDADVEVRASAAFGLGLVGSKEGTAPLIAALKDPSPVVRGSAADGLGLIGDETAATAVADLAAGCEATLAGVEPDAEQWPMTPEIEVCRLSLFALVRLRQFDALATVALTADGQPISHWWPVAYALQRLTDARAAPALLALASGPGTTTEAFAIGGLAKLKDARDVPIARAAVSEPRADVRLRVAGVRALGSLKATASVDMLSRLLSDDATPLNLAVEAATALGAIGDSRAFDVLVDTFSHKAPALRVAAFTAAAKVDPDGFLLIVAGLGQDRDWSVRAALAGIYATLPAERVRPALEALASEDDARVAAAGLSALAKIGAPDLDRRVSAALEAADFSLRATAARVTADRHAPDAVPRLTAAYARGQSDVTDVARTAAIEALARLDGDDAKRVLRDALSDREWPVRLRAAALLRTMGESGAEPMRPAPLRQPADVFESAGMLHPAYSPHAFIETRDGTIEIELNVVESPLTTRSFIELARKGFFNGMRIHRVVPNFVVQAGDTRGDGEGGPGYSLRDELSATPFLRGTVGMALSTKDTGGSQFFITLSPQPHLDGKYAVFGHVVKGLEFLDQLSQWDVIERVRIWDGVTLK